MAITKNVKPSVRGEIEIIVVNNAYPEKGKLCIETMGCGFAWLYTGNYDSLVETVNFVEAFSRDKDYMYPISKKLHIREALLQRNNC